MEQTMADNGKKIIIDEDWKAQAQREKEILKEQEKREKEQASYPGLPSADFAGLVSMLATQAFYALGVIGPQDGREEDRQPDWAMAKFNIDMLGVLEEKCKNNLSDEEDKLLKGTLGQLRMLFVQLSEK